MRYLITKGRGWDVVPDPIVFVPSLSTPSTDAHAQPLGSSVQGDTSHKTQAGHAVGSLLLDEEGPGDRRVPELECAGLRFHLRVTYDPMHIG